MSEEDNFNCKAENQLKDTLYKDILRYAQESDMTAYQVIGVLKTLKFDLLNAMRNVNERGDEDEI